MKRNRLVANPYLNHRGSEDGPQRHSHDWSKGEVRDTKRARIVSSEPLIWYGSSLKSVALNSPSGQAEATIVEREQFRRDTLAFTLLVASRVYARSRVNPHDRSGMYRQIMQLGSAESPSSRVARTVRDRARALIRARTEAAALEPLDETDARELRVIGTRAMISPYAGAGEAEAGGLGLVSLQGVTAVHSAHSSHSPEHDLAGHAAMTDALEFRSGGGMRPR